MGKTRRKAQSPAFADLALKDKRYLTYTHHAYHQLAAHTLRWEKRRLPSV
jgi:hypothetical protein